MPEQTETPGLDMSQLMPYLRRERPGLLAGTPRATLIAGGRSNLTYCLDDGARKWVLRRPPLGHVLATAHDMSREYTVISALVDTAVPVPHTELLCADPDVIGAQFYLMEKVPGVAMRTKADAAPLSERQRRQAGLLLTEVLAALHAIDPGEVGLSEFGRPDGFLRRQVNRWRKQLDASRSRELAGIDELHDWLSEHLPDSRHAAIVHGDYRLDNVLVAANGDAAPAITAVLDWEMATLGDPFTDLGLMHVYWGSGDAQHDAITGGVTRLPGFPTWDELADHYAQRTGWALDGLDWYIAFAYFKLAVVLEGIHYRFRHGGTVGSGFEQIGAMVPQLVEAGLAARG